MEYVEGRQLAKCWPSLNWWSKLRIAFTLRRYIRQLRQLRSSRPGPVGDSPALCEGHIFYDEPRGPFPDYTSLSAFFNKMLAMSKQGGGAHPNTEDFDDSHPLVFTHHDLSLRNVMLGDDGKIWLIDWAWSGFYPEPFEYFATVWGQRADRVGGGWEYLIPFVMGPYFKERAWMGEAHHTMQWYRKKN
jgi:thiamine kinase-like enzyme